MGGDKEKDKKKDSDKKDDKHKDKDKKDDKHKDKDKKDDKHKDKDKKDDKHKDKDKKDDKHKDKEKDKKDKDKSDKEKDKDKSDKEKDKDKDLGDQSWKLVISKNLDNIIIAYEKIYNLFKDIDNYILKDAKSLEDFKSKIQKNIEDLPEQSKTVFNSYLNSL